MGPVERIGFMFHYFNLDLLDAKTQHSEVHCSNKVLTLDSYFFFFWSSWSWGETAETPASRSKLIRQECVLACTWLAKAELCHLCQVALQKPRLHKHTSLHQPMRKGVRFPLRLKRALNAAWEGALTALSCSPHSSLERKYDDNQLVC